MMAPIPSNAETAVPTDRPTDLPTYLPKGYNRTIVVDAKTGMWRSRTTRNQASGAVNRWKVVKMPTVITPSPVVLPAE